MEEYVAKHESTVEQFAAEKSSKNGGTVKERNSKCKCKSNPYFTFRRSPPLIPETVCPN